MPFLSSVRYETKAFSQLFRISVSIIKNTKEQVHYFATYSRSMIPSTQATPEKLLIQFKYLSIQQFKAFRLRKSIKNLCMLTTTLSWTGQRTGISSKACETKWLAGLGLKRHSRLTWSLLYAFPHPLDQNHQKS